MKRLTTVLRCAVAASAIGLLSVPASGAVVRAAAAPRNDYARADFSSALARGLQHFYGSEFVAAENDFSHALAIVPDNTLAIAFLDAASAERQGDLDTLTDAQEDAATAHPSYVAHVRLGFSYLFESLTGRDRKLDAREEFDAAVALDPAAPAAHVGLGIMRFDERSANRAKAEFLAALGADPNDVLAREYLGQLYQTDLRDPQRGLQYVIDVPNLVPHYADIQFHIGSLLADLHQNDAALAYLDRGVALDRNRVGEAGRHGYTLIARIDIDERRFADAKKALDAAIAADVDTIYARALLARIESGAYASPKPGGAP